MPKVLIFAGANGTGKTTLANSVVQPGLRFIDADAIRDKERLSYVEAGKKAILSIDRCILKEINFSFETTMSGLVLKRRFECLKEKRYNIIVFYLFVYPVELLVERIKERVKKGGHPVEEGDITRRYYRSAANFWNIYKNYSSEWAILNNNEFQYKTVALGNNGIYSISDDIEFGKFKEVLKYAKKRK